MKKILGVLTIVVLLVSVCFYFFPKQPKNIFDEIYQETEKTYRSNNILRHIDGFKIRPDWPSDDPNILYTPFGLYLLTIHSFVPSAIFLSTETNILLYAFSKLNPTLSSR